MNVGRSAPKIALMLVTCLIVTHLPFVGWVSGLRSQNLEEGKTETIQSQTSSEVKPEPPHAQLTPEQRWGIQILSTRVSARGYMVDFRYRIVDPEKASVLSVRGVTPYLVDQASGIKLSIPNMPKTGLLRAKVTSELDRDYFMIFGNSRGIVKKGSKVSVVAGDFKVENLTAE
jgi:hypothetical protein